MAEKLKNIDQEAFARIVGDTLDRVVFRHDSAVKRGIEDFKEYLGDLHFDDEKKASMFASFMAQVIESAVTPTVQMAAQMVETDAKLGMDKDVQKKQLEKLDEEIKLARLQNDTATYEYANILPLKRSLTQTEIDKANAEKSRIDADKLRIDADRLRIEANKNQIVDQNMADKDLKAAEKALKDSQKLSEDKKHESGGLIDKQIALLTSQASAFSANKYLKAADSIGQPMGMLMTNDVSPAGGMVTAHRKLIEAATGMILTDYTSVK
jgi:hypothetical protein